MDTCTGIINKYTYDFVYSVEEMRRYISPFAMSMSGCEVYPKSEASCSAKI